MVTGERGPLALLFTGDRSVRRDARLNDLVSTGGDGHASVCSQAAMSPLELCALQDKTFYADRGHFRLSFGPAVLNRLLDIILDTTQPEFSAPHDSRAS